MGALVVMVLLAAGHVGPTDCLRALRPVAAGAVAVAADFEAAPCAGARPGLTYDRAVRAARLLRDADQGEVLRGASSILSAVRPGQTLRLQARIGPVVVEREVQVVRPARPGERIVVRGADGRVFTAPPVEPAL